jgi:hypothetical protein
MRKPVVHYRPADVKARLAELDLDEETMRAAASLGELARASCTENDPSNLPGLLGWAKTVRALRDLSAPRGWRRNVHGQLETMVNGEGTVAVAVITGDGGVGRRQATPRTKYPRGAATVAAVERNQLCFPFVKPAPTAPPPTKLATWVLLVEVVEDEIRLEVSLPLELGDDGRVDEWNERILLQSVPRGTPEGPPNEEEPDIDVPVTKR